MLVVVCVGLAVVIVAQLVLLRAITGLKDALLNEDRTLREQIAKLRLDAIRARVSRDGPV